MHEIRLTARGVESLVVTATMPTKSDLLGDLTTVKEYTKCSDLEYVHVAIANLKSHNENWVWQSPRPCRPRVSCLLTRQQNIRKFLNLEEIVCWSRKFVLHPIIYYYFKVNYNIIKSWQSARPCRRSPTCLVTRKKTADSKQAIKGWTVLRVLQSYFPGAE